jgi:hypothetical protein
MIKNYGTAVPSNEDPFMIKNYGTAVAHRQPFSFVASVASGVSLLKIRPVLPGVPVH